MARDALDSNRSLLEDGSYARNQLFCKWRVIAWSHARRFRLARRLVAPFAGQRLLDFGCGDGSFLALVRDLFPDAVGADLDPKQVASCTSRFASVPGLSFLQTRELAATYSQAFKVITCMEVLEHCTAEQTRSALADFRRLLAPDGALIISVPIEIGPSLAIKELIRWLAGRARIGDYAYKETYTWRELLRMICADEKTAVPRSTWTAEMCGTLVPYHGHKGFNWRQLRSEVRQHFTVRRTCFSPLGWSGGLLSSQAWLICSARV